MFQRSCKSVHQCLVIATLLFSNPSIALATIPSSSSNSIAGSIRITSSSYNFMNIPQGGAAASSMYMEKKNGTDYPLKNETFVNSFVSTPQGHHIAATATAAFGPTPPLSANLMTHEGDKGGASSTVNPLSIASGGVKGELPIDGELEKELKKISEQKGGPLRVLFLSADTGGGHRASAESLANQFVRHYPGTTYELMDVWTPTNVYPYRTLVPAYKHLSANPSHWKVLYHISNTRPYEFLTDLHSTATCYRKIKRQMETFDFDVVISVHPTMNFVPMKVARKIAKKKGKYIPFFTVVTDFGSAHCTWFQKGVDKMYIASERIRKLAKRRGNVPNEKLVMSGLPIRYDFAVQAEKMGDRASPSGKIYRQMIKNDLGLDPNKKVILVMGGGEGVGSLSTITDGLYHQLRKEGVDATICVVCGRNEKLRKELQTKIWEVTPKYEELQKKRFSVLRFLRSPRRKVTDSLLREDSESSEHDIPPGNVDVVGLGFITNMAEYMVAADVLVSKAGPGTIAEAAAVGLPVMITSFLPGQEAGNVDIVLDGGFGDFRQDPNEIGNGVAGWLKDPSLMEEMGRKAAQVGQPNAASNIVKEIGDITHEWMKKNERVELKGQ